jgi:hypothetical protein
MTDPNPFGFVGCPERIFRKALRLISEEEITPHEMVQIAQSVTAIAIEAQRAVTVKQGTVRSTKARACKASPNSPMNTPTHEGDVE